MAKNLITGSLTIEDNVINQETFYSLSAVNQWKVIAICSIARLHKEQKIRPLTPEQFDKFYDMPYQELESLRQLMWDVFNRIEGE